MKERKCKNCGGSFNGVKCPWCRTVYEEEPDNEWEAWLVVNGERIHGYVTEKRFQRQDLESFRTPDGYLTRRVLPPKREFTFLEI